MSVAADVTISQDLTKDIDIMKDLMVSFQVEASRSLNSVKNDMKALQQSLREMRDDMRHLAEVSDDPNWLAIAGDIITIAAGFDLLHEAARRLGGSFPNLARMLTIFSGPAGWITAAGVAAVEFATLAVDHWSDAKMRVIEAEEQMSQATGRMKEDFRLWTKEMLEARKLLLNSENESIIKNIQFGLLKNQEYGADVGLDFSKHPGGSVHKQQHGQLIGPPAVQETIDTSVISTKEIDAVLDKVKVAYRQGTLWTENLNDLRNLIQSLPGGKLRRDLSTMFTGLLANNEQLGEVNERLEQFNTQSQNTSFKQFQDEVSSFISAFNTEMKAFGQDVAIERFRGQFESILETGARLGQEIPAQLQPIVAIFQAHEAELQRLAEERIKALAADEAKLAEDKRLEELRAHWNEQAKLRDEALLQWGSFGDRAAVLADQAREEISRVMLLFNYDQEKVTTTSINIWQDYFSKLGEEGKAMAAQMVAMATLTGAWSQEAVAALAFLKGQFGNDNKEEDNDVDTGYWDTIGSAASTAFIDGFRSTMRNLNDIGDAVGVAFGEAFTASGGQMILNWVNGADGTFETVEEALNEKFGELFGGIAASFLPVFGQLISSGVSSILSSFASMFGGPSNEEIAERGGKQMGWRWGSAFTSEAKAAFQRALEELPKAASGKYNVGLAKVAPEVLQEIVAGFSSFSDEIQRKLAMDIGNGINSFAQALGLTLEESFQRYAPVIEDAFSAALEFGESLNPELLGLIEHARNLGIEFEGFQDAVAEAFEEVISSSDISVEKLKQIATTARQVGVDAEEALRDAFDGALEGAELTFEAIAEIRRAAEEMGLDVALESALAVSRVLKSEIDELTAGIGLAASNAHAVREGLEKLLTANVIDVEKIQSLVEVAREAGVSVESVFNRAFKQFIRDGDMGREQLLGLVDVAREAGLSVEGMFKTWTKTAKREFNSLRAEGAGIGESILDLNMQLIQGRQQAVQHREGFKESYTAKSLEQWEKDRQKELERMDAAERDAAERSYEADKTSAEERFKQEGANRYSDLAERASKIKLDGKRDSKEIDRAIKNLSDEEAQVVLEIAEQNQQRKQASKELRQQKKLAEQNRKAMKQQKELIKAIKDNAEGINTAMAHTALPAADGLQTEMETIHELWMEMVNNPLPGSQFYLPESETESQRPDNSGAGQQQAAAPLPPVNLNVEINVNAVDAQSFDSFWKQTGRQTFKRDVKNDLGRFITKEVENVMKYRGGGD